MDSSSNTKITEESDMERVEDHGDNQSKAMSDPIQAEAADSMRKARRLPPDKADSIQDEEISSSVVTEMPRDEDGFPTGLEKMVPADVHIAEEDYPDFKKDGQFDGLLVYHENYKEKACYCLDKLQGQNHLSGRPIRIATLEQGKGGHNQVERLEYYCKKSTFLMMMLTENFCDDDIDDNWMRFYQNAIIIETVVTPEKKWCAIPIHTEYWRKPVSYKVPFALQGIRGICLTDDNWDEGAVNMIRQKERLLIDRELKQEREFKNWLLKEQQNRLKQWKCEKENLKKERERILQDLAETDTMEYDTQPILHPYAPSSHTQNNVCVTGEQCPPGVPQQAWGNDANRSVPQNQFTGPFPQAGATTTPHQSPGGPGLSPGVPDMKFTPEMWMQALFALQQGMMPAPVFNISAEVINFGNNSQTTVQKSTEDDSDTNEEDL